MELRGSERLTDPFHFVVFKKWPAHDDSSLYFNSTSYTHGENPNFTFTISSALHHQLHKHLPAALCQAMLYLSSRAWELLNWGFLDVS